jgi:hypothetical protein
MAQLDRDRSELLKHPKEGILFLTHEIEAVCLEHFDLVEFPYDTQAMAIKVRVEKGPGDPLNRFLVPLCIDKVCEVFKILLCLLALCFLLSLIYKKGTNHTCI